MAKSALDAITRKAKAMYNKRGNRKSWQQCIKAASREYNKKGSVGATKKKYRQTGRSQKKRDLDRKAKPPGKRTSRSGNKYTERRKNRSDVPGTMRGAVYVAPGELQRLPATSLKSALLSKFKQTRDKAVVNKYNADKKSVKKKWQKRISEMNANIRRYS